jgi:hypothetical protein
LTRYRNGTSGVHARLIDSPREELQVWRAKDGDISEVVGVLDLATFAAVART